MAKWAINSIRVNSTWISRMDSLALPFLSAWLNPSMVNILPGLLCSPFQCWGYLCPKHNNATISENHLIPFMLVFIHWVLSDECPCAQLTVIFQFVFLHHFVMANEYTNMTGFRWFSNFFTSLCFRRKCPQETVKLCTILFMSSPIQTANRTIFWK